MTSKPVTNAQASNYTVETLPAHVPASPAMNPTKDLKLNMRATEDNFQKPFGQVPTEDDSNATETEADTHFNFARYTRLINHEFEKWGKTHQA